MEKLYLKIYFCLLKTFYSQYPYNLFHLSLFISDFINKSPDIFITLLLNQLFFYLIDH